MARMNLSSQCPCGFKLHANVRKPTRFQHTIVKINCASCRSRFEVTATVDRNEPGRVYKHHFEILDLSEKACEALKPKALDGPPAS
jgi:hypothetical protein